jgi:DNA-binding NarL/FixJ family response regulator
MMPTVAVIDPTPSYRLGLASELSRAGYEVVPEHASWVVVSFTPPEGCAILDALHGDGTPFVALLQATDAASIAHALLHGASGVARWDDDPSVITDALSRSVGGEVALDPEVARRLALEWPDPHSERPSVSPEEVGWLVQLAAGTTVARLAEEVGYSERVLFRRLHDLYTRLGANSRSEAILAAERLGLLGTGDPA